MQLVNGGVTGMLEVIESDSARLEADATAAEAIAQKDGFMTDSKVDKESDSKDIEHMTAMKQDEFQALTMKSEELEGPQKELDPGEMDSAGTLLPASRSGKGRRAKPNGAQLPSGPPAARLDGRDHCGVVRPVRSHRHQGREGHELPRVRF